MTKAATYARSLIASWAGYGGSIIVMFFLSPFVVHELGDARFGMWSLLMSITGYLGLVEVGVRASTGRYVNLHLGRGRLARVDAVINTSLAFYCLASVLVLVIAAVLGWAFPHLFPRVHPDLASQAPSILLMMAVNVWLNLWGSTFGQLLMARNRFDLINMVHIGVLAVRAAATVGVLLAGWGLLALSAVNVLCSALMLLGNGWSARRYGVRVHYTLKLASWPTFREMFSYGAWSFLGNASTRAIFYASAAIIGVMLGESEITYYSIGLMLIDTGRDVVAFVCRVLTPDIQKLAGRSPRELGGLMTAAANATMLVAVGLLGGLTMLGPAFIRQWMGPQYERCGDVLEIIAASQMGVMANFACNTALSALGHVRLVAIIFAIEALLNLAISVLLVSLGWGIVGVAWGTAVPALFCSGLVTMYFACRHTGLPVRQYLWSTAGRWVPATLAYLPLCYVVHRWLGMVWVHGELQYKSGWGILGLQILICGLLYLPIALVFIIPRERTAAAVAALSSRVRRAVAPQEVRT